MSGSIDVLSALDLAAAVISIGLCSSTAYRAISLSKALPGQLYKTRAEWVGSFSIVLVGFVVVGSASGSAFFGNFVQNFLSGVNSYLGSFVAVFLCAWLSSTIGVTAELDFFHRDTWHWGSIRKLFWAGVALAATANILVSTAELNPCVGAICGTTSQLVPVLGLASGLLLFILVVYASIVLFLSGRRVGDRVIRSHVQWLVLFVLTIIVAFLVSPAFPFTLIAAIGSYTLFRSSSFLVPAERIGSVVIRSQVPVSKKPPTGPGSLRYRVTAISLIMVSLLLAGVVLQDDGLLKKLAPGNAEAFTSVTIIYGILFVLLVTRVKLGFTLGLLSSSLWLFAQIANVLIPVNSFVTQSNIAQFFPDGFASYVLGFAPVYDPALCPHTCPPFQYAGLLSLVIQAPLVLSCYLGLRAERKASRGGVRALRSVAS